jgi:hypothetical protein
VLRLLPFMHHIALCTPCIALVNGGHLFAYALDHTESKTKIQAVQVLWVSRGSQASSYEDTDIVVTKASPSASNPILEFYYNFILFMILDCALDHRSCIGALVA